MDLESSGATLPRRAADRRSVSRPPTLVGLGPEALPQPRRGTEILDEGTPKAPARQRENRKAGCFAALHCFNQCRSARKDSHRVGLLPAQCRTYALPRFPAPTPVRRLRRHRSRLQNCHRFPSQTIRYVLDPPRSQRHHCLAMLPPQWPFRKLLGGTPCGLINFRVARPSLWSWVQPPRLSSLFPVSDPVAQRGIHKGTA